MISDLDRFFAELETEEFSVATKPNATMATPMDPKPDPYGARVRAAFSNINCPDYPEGMVAWLDGAHPDLHEELISRIPRKIDQLWNKSAPLEQFQAVLDRWVVIHREGCQLYREERAVSVLTTEYLPEKSVASERAQPVQNPAFKDFPTPEGCEISEESELAEDAMAMASNPERPR